MKAEIAGYPVPLSRIESELAAIWRRGEGEGGMRASTMNLIVLTTRREFFETFRHSVPEISAHHPGRVLLVLCDAESDTASIESTLSAFCQIPGDSARQICCEQINLETGRPGLEHLQGIATPLLLPDLPVYFWIVESDLLTGLAGFESIADRIIVKSPARFESQEAFVRFSQRIRAVSREGRISDMRWAGLTPWREAVAHFFDGSGGRERLDALYAVNIKSRELWTGALLLGGWLRSRLPAVESGREIRFSLQRRSGPEQGFSVHLLTRDSDGGRVECRVSGRGAESLYAEIAGRHGIRPSKSISMRPPSTVRQLCDELDYLNADRIYLESLTAAVEWQGGASP